MTMSICQGTHVHVPGSVRWFGKFIQFELF